MHPGTANPRPKALFAFAVADLVGNVARQLRARGFIVFSVGHVRSPLFAISGHDHRGLVARTTEAGQPGRRRTGQQKIGGDLQGEPILCLPDWRRFVVPSKEGRMS